jgi:hypothetical protein
MRQPIFAVDTQNKYRDIVEDVEIANNKMGGFNSGWASSMPKQPSLCTVLEDFLLKETVAETIINKDVVARGGSDMHHNPQSSPAC